MARPIGATTRPQFYTYITEIERKEYVKWILKAYKRKPELAKWMGDQMFGKAIQPLGNDVNAKGELTPLLVKFLDAKDSGNSRGI